MRRKITPSAHWRASSPITLLKAGAGTLTLGVNNSYTGGTLITGGTVSLNTVGAAGSGNITAKQWQSDPEQCRRSGDNGEQFDLPGPATLTVTSGKQQSGHHRTGPVAAL